MRMMTNGHFRLNVGDLREIDLAGNIVRDVTVAQVNRQLIAQRYRSSISIINPQTVWQLCLTGENLYRVDRIPSLYPGVSWSQ